MSIYGLKMQKVFFTKTLEVLSQKKTNEVNRTFKGIEGLVGGGRSTFDRTEQNLCGLSALIDWLAACRRLGASWSDFSCPDQKPGKVQFG